MNNSFGNTAFSVVIKIVLCKFPLLAADAPVNCCLGKNKKGVLEECV